MTTALPIPTLLGERMTLRPFTLDDAPAVYTHLSTPEIASTTANINYPYPQGAAENWIQSHATEAAAGTSLTGAIALSDDTVIGAIAKDPIAQQVANVGAWRATLQMFNARLKYG